MNENTARDLEILAKQFAKDGVDGIKTWADIATEIAEFSTDKAKAIWYLIKVIIPDLTKDAANVLNTVECSIKVIHDILPSNKTRYTLSNGEIIERHYYETPDTFQARIDKEEARIAINK